MAEKCKHKEGQITELFGYPVDPCIYKPIERYANVTVTINKCIHCGHVEIDWMRQEDTEELEIYE